MDVDERLGGRGHERYLPPVPDSRQHGQHDYDGHAHDRTAADGVGMNRALPWASPELLTDAALELEYLDSLLLVLSGAARGLFGVNMGAITADWPEEWEQSASFQ